MRLIYIALFSLYGLLIGSFLNVCVYRLPRKEKITTERSHCTTCGHILGPLDLIPVASYLMLGGRCRYCHAKISSRYALVELSTALMFTLSALVVRPDQSGQLLAEAVLLSVLASSLLVWSLIRLDRQSPPLSLYIWLAGGAAGFVALQANPLNFMIGMLSCLLAAMLLYYLRLWQVLIQKSGHEVLGMTFCGLALGWPGTAVLIAFTIMLLAALNVWRNYKYKSESQPGRWLALIIFAVTFISIILRYLETVWFY